MTLNQKITLKGVYLLNVKGKETFNKKFYNLEDAIKNNVRFAYVNMQDQCEEGYYWSSIATTKGKLVWFLRYNGVWTDPNSCTSLASKITKGIDEPRNIPKLKLGMILG